MLFEPLFAHAAQKPDEIAIIDDRGEKTWQQLATAAAGIGLLLSMQTEQPRVGILLPTSAAFAISFYGTLLAGKAVVPINFLLGDKEIAHIIKDSGIDTVLTVTPLLPKVKDLPLKAIDLLTLSAGSLPPDFKPELPSPKAEDIALLMYTSGTSGLPKGVMITYGNLQSDVLAAIQHAQLSGSHVFLGILPLFHSTGLIANLVAPITLGAKSIFQSSGFRPNHVLKAVRDHQISILAAVPSMYGAMARLKGYGPEDVKSVYAALSGGEPLPAVIRDAFMEKFGKPIYEGYGLTETIGPISLNVPGQHCPGSVGRMIPGAEVRIAADDGTALPQGQTGEVWLKGPMVMKGYNNLAEETAAALTPDGYFKSGDLGIVDAGGYLHITGRKKDQINVAGEKCSPREIEDVLNKHPAVAESAVVGKKDPSRGEVVAAFIILRETQTVIPDALRDFCRDQGLVQWKIPRDIQFVADLPRSPTGKVLKRVLVEQLGK
jgi:long-chain acyl-CoA synthetase